MMSLLPTSLQERVLAMLNDGDFVTAKSIYDEWHYRHTCHFAWEKDIPESDTAAENSCINYSS